MEETRDAISIDKKRIRLLRQLQSNLTSQMISPSTISDGPISRFGRKILRTSASELTSKSHIEPLSNSPSATLNKRKVRSIFSIHESLQFGFRSYTKINKLIDKCKINISNRSLQEAKSTTLNHIDNVKTQPIIDLSDDSSEDEQNSEKNTYNSSVANNDEFLQKVKDTTSTEKPTAKSIPIIVLVDNEELRHTEQSLHTSPAPNKGKVQTNFLMAANITPNPRLGFQNDAKMNKLLNKVTDTENNRDFQEGKCTTAATSIMEILTQPHPTIDLTDDVEFTGCYDSRFLAVHVVKRDTFLDDDETVNAISISSSGSTDINDFELDKNKNSLSKRCDSPKNQTTMTAPIPISSSSSSIIESSSENSADPKLPIVANKIEKYERQTDDIFLAQTENYPS